jgi:hypothetical protein
LDRYLILPERNLGLRCHNTGLAAIDIKLRKSHADQSESQKNLYPVRSLKIDKGFRGIPMAAGWFFAWLCIWYLLASIAHDRQSCLVGAFAFLAIGADCRSL